MQKSIPGRCDECHRPAENGNHICLRCMESRADALLGVVTPESTIPWRTASDVVEETTEWLWWNRIALGEITLVGGDPGQGKSQFTAALAARVSSGMALPDGGETVKGSVIFASLEDHPGKTVRPRLRRQGADLDRILIPDQFKDENGNSRRMRASDIPALEMAMELQGDVKLMVVDPVMAYMGGKVDTNKDNEVRDILNPLANLAQRNNIAVVVVAHLNKGDAGSVLYKISGSVGFAALPRSVLLIAQHQETKRRGIAHIKSNLGPEMDTVEFTLDEDGFHWGALAPDLTALKLVDKGDGRRVTEERDIAKSWLKDALREGPQYSNDLFELAEACGISRTTLGRAKRDMGVMHRRWEGKVQWLFQ